MSENRCSKPAPQQVIHGLSDNVGVVIRQYDAPESVADLISICEKKGLTYLIALRDKSESLEMRGSRHRGFHLPRHMHSYADAIKKRAPHFIITASLHNAEEARRLARLPVDAAIVSPFFAVSQKKTVMPLGAENFQKLTDISGKPAYALGGITAKNMHEALAAGACGVAGVSLFYPVIEQNC